MRCDRCSKKTNKLWSALDRKKCGGKVFKDSPRMCVCADCMYLQWLESFPIQVIPGQKIWMRHTDDRAYETARFQTERTFSTGEEMTQYVLDNNVLV